MVTVCAGYFYILLRLWKFAIHQKAPQISYAAKFVLDRFPHRCLEGILHVHRAVIFEVAIFLFAVVILEQPTSPQPHLNNHAIHTTTPLKEQRKQPHPNFSGKQV